MFRTLFSAVTILLLGAMAFLLYTNYFGRPAPAAPSPEKPSVSASPDDVPAPGLLRPRNSSPDPGSRDAVGPGSPAADRELVRAAPAKPKRTHVVEAGDSLWAISGRYYGSPDHHPKIAAANGLRGNAALRVGQVLVLPELPEAPFDLARAADNAADRADHPLPEGAAGNEEPAHDPQPPTLNTRQRKPQ